MSFGQKETTPDPVVAGTEEEDVSTVQESIPIPYVAGERKVAARWLSNVYNQFSVEVAVDTGKKGSKKSGSEGSGVYDYYGSIAAFVCTGAVDHLAVISIDGKQVWADPNDNANRAASPSSFYGEIPGYGSFTFYWGEDDQTLLGTSILKSSNNDRREDHPNYRGIAVIEFKDFLFGREKVSAPNVEIVVGRAPQQSLVTGTAADRDDGQANPLTAVAELMTNTRYGLGIDASRFNGESFNTTAEALEDNKSLTYCSPFLNKQASVRSVLTDLYVMTDAFLTWDASSAEIKAGYWTHGALDTGSLVPIVDEDLTEMPELEASGWSGIKSGWVVSFADRTRMYKESSDKYDDLSLRDIIGETSRDTMPRPWITRRDQAMSHASEWGKAHARPSLMGSITVRKSSADLVDVGTLFTLDIDPEPSGQQLNQVFRLISKQVDQTGAVELEVEAENNLVPVSYVPALPVSPDETGFPIPEAFEYVRPMEMPPTFSNSDYGLVVLAQRADNLTTGYGVLYDDEATGDFPALGTQRSFGVVATLDAPFLASAKGSDEAGYDPAVDAPVIDLTNTNFLDLINMPDDLGLVGARDDQLLLILAQIEDAGPRAGQVKLDPADGHAIMEMLSVSAIVVEPGQDGFRTIEAIRGRFSTGQRDFPAGSEAWLARRSSMDIYVHEDFKASATEPQEISYFKTEPSNIFQTRDISGDGTVEFLFPTARLFAPKIAVTLPILGPFTGVPYEVSGLITDQDGDLSNWSISYREAGGSVENEVSVAGGPLEPSSSYAFKAPVTIFVEGSYEIVVRAQDSTTFVDGYVESVHAVTASVAQSTISTPTNFKASNNTDNPPARQNAIWLDWVNPLSPSAEGAVFDSVSIYESLTNDVNTAAFVMTTGAEFASFAVEDEKTHYFWILAKDRSGNKSARAQSSTNGVAIKVEVDIPPLSITETEIANDAISTPKIQANAITANEINAGAVTANAILTNEIITDAANIANAVITNAKISDLSAAKITAGTIETAVINMKGAGSVLQSDTFGATTGWKIDGTGAAIFDSATIRNDTIVASGVDNVIKSANYVPNTSGWVIKGDGSAEFFDVNIYGEVPVPQLSIAGTPLVDGGVYEYLSSVTLDVSSAQGTTSRYTTDGTEPTGFSTVVPVSGQIPVAVGDTVFKVKAFEDATAKSSLSVVVSVRLSVPAVLNSLGSSGVRVRSFKKLANYILIGYGGASTSPYVIDTTGTGFTRLSVSTFTNIVGDAYGIQSAIHVPSQGNSVVMWYCFATGTDISTRVGLWYAQGTVLINASGQMDDDMGDSVNAYNDIHNDFNDTPIDSYPLVQDIFDTNDYPNIFT